GAEEFMSGDGDSVAGIAVVNEQVVKLELSQPVAFFLSTLCTEYCYIVPREEVERSATSFEVRPVGSGPFRVVEPVLGKDVQLERCSNYWNPELPYVDRLKVHLGLNAEEIFEMFLRGELGY